MAEDFQGFLNRGQLFLQSLFPATLAYNGVEFACASSGARKGEDLEEGGFVETGGRNVRILKSQMEYPPQHGERITLDGIELRVVEIGDRPWDVSWHLYCVPLREF